MDNNRSINSRTRIIRDSIKSIIAQLDRWEEDRQTRERRRKEANVKYPNGLADRQAIARFRAKNALGTQKLSDPPCDRCGSNIHLTDECDIVAQEVGQRDFKEEDPSVGIHRAIVHRLYLQACDLYRLLYPSFYPDPIPLVAGPDYLSLAISQAVDDFRLLPGFRPADVRHQRSSCSSVAQLYYSKVFPISFGDFCVRIADSLEEQSSD
jgi:hypothetical protein